MRMLPLLFCCCAFLSAAEPLAGADAARLEAMVRRMSDGPTPRSHLQIARLDAVADWIAETFTGAGLRVEAQRFEVDGRSYRNLIGSLGPEDAPRLIIGAHYDACGDTPGADDNASGVAGLLHLAQLLAPQAAGLHRRLDFVAFTLEEPPYFGSADMGSAVHARALREAGVHVEGMICLEMIGYFTDAPNSQRYPHASMSLLYPSTGDFIGLVANQPSATFGRRLLTPMQQHVDTRFLVAPDSIPLVGLSDHRNYWAAGMPAVMVTDTAFMRNPHYHQESDTADTLDYRRMALVVDGLRAAVQAVDAVPIDGE